MSREEDVARCPTCGCFASQTSTGVSEGGVPTIRLFCRRCDKKWTEDWG